MPKKRSLAILLVVLFLGQLLASSSCQAPQSDIIRQIDHIVIISGRSEELFSLLSDKFQFPVVWPMTNYGRFKSGGVALGNVNLEIISVPPPINSTESARFLGFALEPHLLESALLELDVRGIAHSSPSPYITADKAGEVVTLWTTAGLPDLSNDAMMVFLCEYTHDTTAQRQASLDQLLSRDGGPLSVISVQEIVFGTADLEKTREQWQELLNPLRPSFPDVWQIGSGPAIHIVQANEDGIQEIVIGVRSLTRARGYLEEQGLLGSVGNGKLTIESPVLQGLNIRLVEMDS